MKGSKLRCMFYCIYKYYIYIIDWLIKYICEWKQMLLYTHHHCLTHSQMIGWQLISSVTSDIIMSILPMQNQPRMSMFFNFLIVFFLSKMSNLLMQLQNRIFNLTSQLCDLHCNFTIYLFWKVMIVTLCSTVSAWLKSL
jgi:hypothetical protein